MVVRCLRLFLIPALLAAVSVPLTWAQDVPSPDAPPVSTVPPADDTTPATPPKETLHVTSNLVTEYFTVRDKHNALIPNLSKDDCSVLDDKQPQKLVSFQAQATQPLTLGLLIDTSGSQQYLLPMEQQAANEFLTRVMRPKDEAFVVSFDIGVNLEQDFTGNVAELKRAINHVRINTGGGNGQVGIPGAGQGPFPTQGDPKGTVLYDAVFETSTQKMSGQIGRKALILLTDGEDEGSDMKIGQAIAAAQNADAIVYVILIADPSQYMGYGYGGMPVGMYTGGAAMHDLTVPTGGHVINAGRNGKKLQDAFDEIEEELRTQYEAQYIPSTPLNGSFHPVDVACHDSQEPKLKVQARKGYFSIPNSDNDQ
jgi:VWFA-related protein